MKECGKTGFTGGKMSIRRKEGRQVPSVTEVRLKAAAEDEMFDFLERENISPQTGCVHMHLRE